MTAADVCLPLGLRACCIVGFLDRSDYMIMVPKKKKEDLLWHDFVDCHHVHAVATISIAT